MFDQSFLVGVIAGVVTNVLCGLAMIAMRRIASLRGVWSFVLLKRIFICIRIEQSKTSEEL
jgi:hypothetical protein